MVEEEDNPALLLLLLAVADGDDVADEAAAAVVVAAEEGEDGEEIDVVVEEVVAPWNSPWEDASNAPDVSPLLESEDANVVVCGFEAAIAVAATATAELVAVVVGREVTNVDVACTSTQSRS